MSRPDTSLPSRQTNPFVRGISLFKVSEQLADVKEVKILVTDSICYIFAAGKQIMEQYLRQYTRRVLAEHLLFISNSII